MVYSAPAGASVDRAYEWLLAACRAWLLERGGETAPSSGLPDGIDPAVLMNVAHWQGVEPLLHVLAQSRPEIAGVADAVRAGWERAYYGTRLRNGEALATLAEVVAECRAAGVEVLVMKGPALIADVWHDIGLRPMIDLDVMCRARDLPAVARVLRRAGFAAGQPYLHELEFTDAAGGPPIDLHFGVPHFVENGAGLLDSAWAGAVVAEAESWRFPVMPLEHQIVFETAHCLTHHGRLDLRRIVDLAGRLKLRARAIDRGKLHHLLSVTGLLESHRRLVQSLELLLELPLGGEGRLQGPHPVLDAVASRQIGARTPRRTASEFMRQRGMRARLVFARKRLFPQVVALQAAYGFRSRAAAALLGPPRYVASTLWGLCVKFERGF